MTACPSLETYNSEPWCKWKWACLILPALKTQYFKSLEMTLKKKEMISQLIYTTSTEDSIAIFNQEPELLY